MIVNRRTPGFVDQCGRANWHAHADSRSEHTVVVQLGDAKLSAPGPNGGNWIAVMVWHLSGNLASRFTN